MFFDWLTIEQDFQQNLPFLGDIAYQRLNIDTGESGVISQPVFKHNGSYCDSLSLKIRGSVLQMSGNPSRWGRVDNLFGLNSIDACVFVYNKILRELNIPEFTKGKTFKHRQASVHSKAGLVFDGAIIKRLDITGNVAVGQGNELAYISGISTLNYRNSLPNLHANGNTCDWKSKLGNSNLIYPKVYGKAYEIKLHSLTKIKNTFGETSSEYKYLLDIVNYCEQNGIIRFEQGLQSRYLQKHNLCYYGLSDFNVLNDLHDGFINLNKKLSVNAMDFETISERLIVEGVVDSTRSANTTAMYAIQWMHGQVFDFNKKQVQTHRARLRKIGIDIAQRCNISKFSPIYTRDIREVKVKECVIPDWYKRANHLKAA